MDLNRSTTVEEIFTAEAVVAGATVYSRIFDIKKLAGNASLQITLTGTGTGQFEWIGSNDEDALIAAFIKVNAATDIVTAFTAGSAIYSFNISLVSRMAIRVTETGGVNPIGVTAILAIQ